MSLIAKLLIFFICIVAMSAIFKFVVDVCFLFKIFYAY